ncbi:MAG TPA: SDR family NAD(P)-dependent oxidoreductase [Planctomycetota bacterium]|nr:SDR family NAD(P)-dependent oxidoreductase [Planctomycetota bacterium]
MKPQSVLVTGGAGFIGSELVRQLVDAGHNVIAVDNLVSGKRENVDGLPASNFKFVKQDIREQGAMAALLQKVQVVFHLACLGVRHSIHSPVENHEVNAAATLHLLGLARASGVKRFVYVSSSEVYGTAKWVPMTEEHPTYPATVYGSSKLAGECYTRAYWHTYEYPTVVVRPFNAYGPRCHHEGDSGEVIPKFMLRSMVGKPMIIFGDGTQTRDFTFVSDTARGIALAGFSDKAVGHTINLGNGREIQINELAKTVADIMGISSAKIEHDAPRPADVLRLCAETKKARELLDFAPTISLKDGLKKLLAWYKASGKSAEALLEDERVHNWKPMIPAPKEE